MQSSMRDALLRPEMARRPWAPSQSRIPFERSVTDPCVASTEHMATILRIVVSLYFVLGWGAPMVYTSKATTFWFWSLTPTAC